MTPVTFDISVSQYLCIIVYQKHRTVLDALIYKPKKDCHGLLTHQNLVASMISL